MRRILLILALFSGAAKADTISNLVMTVNNDATLTLTFHVDFALGSVRALEVGMTSDYGCEISLAPYQPISLGAGNYRFYNIVVPGAGQGTCNIFGTGATLHYQLVYNNDIGDPVFSADQTFVYGPVTFPAVVTRVQTYVTSNTGAAYITVNAGAPIAPISAVNMRTSDNSFIAAGGASIIFVEPSLVAITSATVVMAMQNNAFNVNIYALPTASTFTARITYWSNPTNTPTVTNTITKTPTPTATITATFSRTVTPSITPSRTASPSPSRTITPAATLTITATRTITPGNTKTITKTITPTQTITTTRTITPTATPTPTITPTATRTVTPTSTETPV